jgi:hypothetical protein
LLKPEVLEQCFAPWLASLQEIVRGVVAVDGKALRSSKQAADGSGALHFLSTYACEAGLVIGQCAIDQKATRSKHPRFFGDAGDQGHDCTIDAMEHRKRLPRRLWSKKPITFWRLKEQAGR